MTDWASKYGQPAPDDMAQGQAQAKVSEAQQEQQAAQGEINAIDAEQAPEGVDPAEFEKQQALEKAAAQADLSSAQMQEVQYEGEVQAADTGTLTPSPEQQGEIESAGFSQESASAMQYQGDVSEAELGDQASPTTYGEMGTDGLVDRYGSPEVDQDQGMDQEPEPE